MRCISLRRRFLPFVSASSALCVIGLFGCAPEEADQAPTPTLDVVAGDENADATKEPDSVVGAQDVQVRTADRAEFDKAVAGLKGKVVLVDYWATWCGPCTEQFPHTVAKANELGSKGLAAISVSFDDPADPDPILEFLREQKARPITNLVSAHGASPESNEAFDVGGGIPWYQLYDRTGALKYVFCDAPEAGVEALPVAELDAKIEELLAEAK